MKSYLKNGLSFIYRMCAEGKVSTVRHLKSIMEWCAETVRLSQCGIVQNHSIVPRQYAVTHHHIQKIRDKLTLVSESPQTLRAVNFIIGGYNDFTKW